MRLIALILAALAPTLATPSPARAEPLTFLALADVTDRPAYERFVAAVIPVWNRHGMTVLMRLAPMEAPGGYDDAVVIDVESREGFRAYLEDPDYRTIAADRLAAVDALVILEGPRDTVPKAPPPGAFVSVVMQTACAPGQPGLRVSLVGAVKAEPPAEFEATGCVRILAADDAPTGDVVTGFAATVR